MHPGITDSPGNPVLFFVFGKYEIHNGSYDECHDNAVLGEYLTDPLGHLIEGAGHHSQSDAETESQSHYHTISSV